VTFGPSSTATTRKGALAPSEIETLRGMLGTDSVARYFQMGEASERCLAEGYTLTLNREGRQSCWYKDVVYDDATRGMLAYMAMLLRARAAY
jgi:hypothetical protein